nr:pre-rRNA-processing protein IPI3-like isoform X1 [Populus alba]
MTGRLLKKWRAHYRTVTCLVFTEDDSLLVSGSEDVSVRVWSLLVIFDDYQTEQASTLYEHSFQEHILRVTDMVTEMARYTLLRSMLLAHLAKVTGCISSVHYLVTGPANNIHVVKRMASLNPQCCQMLKLPQEGMDRHYHLRSINISIQRMRKSLRSS